MRAGVSTVQQTLTTEAANVLKLAVAEAQRRGHAQVTPLHVATTLLGGTASVLRQACVQSHLHLPQPPHCRNLELCFKVALDRLQTTAGGTATTAGGTSSLTPIGLTHPQHGSPNQPALSNALVAALKRAQAHQRRGYPEQQQVPLLAVKVEMEQLIISILDDPSVSRVMREASFSSTQVKNSLEEALAAAAAAASSASAASSTCAAQARRILPAATGSLVVNPSVDRLRLKLGSLEQYGAASFNLPPPPRSAAAPLLLTISSAAGIGSSGSGIIGGMSGSGSGSGTGGMCSGIGGRAMSSDAGRVFEILLKSKKRNPLLFGEQAPHGVAEEVLQRLEKGECGDPSLRSLRIVSPQFASIALGLHARDEVEQKLVDLVRAVEKNILCSAGVVVYLGDLQWLVERSSPSPSPSVYCPVQHAVSEIGKLVASQGTRVWLLAVASSQTYMRCQARHPSLDTLWGLQPLPISTGFSLTLRNNGNNHNRFGSSSAVDSPAVRSLPGRWPMLPPFKLQQQQQGGEDELSNCCSECVAKYEQEAHDVPPSSSDESASNGLPFWLKPTKDPDQGRNNQKLRELQKKWSQTCKSRHGGNTAVASPVQACNGGTKVACSTGGSSLPMSIPWLSLQPQIGGGNKGTPLAPEKNGLTIHTHGKDVGSVCNSSSEDVLSTDIGLNLKPSSNGSSRTEQRPKESEVTVQTDLVLGRSGKLSSNVNGKLNNLFQKTRPTSIMTTPFPPFVSPPPPEKRYQTLGSEKQQVPAPLVTVTSNFKPPPTAKELDFKALCKALAESVPWQKDAVDSIASTVLHCRSGGEKRRGGANFKYDAWLLLLGSDAPAKRRVAKVLAEQVFGSDKMLFRLSLSSPTSRDVEVSAGPGRGRTPLDKLAEAVRSKPFSVVLLEDVEQADPRLKTALTKAMERGRLADSSGREVSVANLIVVMTSNVGEEVFPRQEMEMAEMNEAEVVGMKLLVEEAAAPELVTYTSGRVSVVRSSDEPGSPSPATRRENSVTKVGVELDLNMPLEEEQRNGEVLFEEVSVGDEPVSEDGQVKLLLDKAGDQLSKQFMSKVSGTVVFKPFNFNKLAELVVSEMNNAVSASKLSIEVESGLLKHLVAALWQGKHEEFQKWMIQVLDTSVVEKLKDSDQQQQQQHVIKLVADRSGSSTDVVRLPKRIKIGDGGT